MTTHPGSVDLEHIECEDEEYCPMCGGECVHTGGLGNLEWWRCINCGWEHSTPKED